MFDYFLIFKFVLHVFDVPTCFRSICRKRSRNAVSTVTGADGGCDGAELCFQVEKLLHKRRMIELGTFFATFARL